MRCFVQRVSLFCGILVSEKGEGHLNALVRIWTMRRRARFWSRRLTRVSARRWRRFQPLSLGVRCVRAESRRGEGQDQDADRGYFASTKTPLANILLYTGLLEEEALPERGRAYVAALGLQAQKLQFLIDALVKTSRLETGVLALRPKEHEVLHMLSRAVAARQKAAAKRIRVTLLFDRAPMRQEGDFLTRSGRRRRF